MCKNFVIHIKLHALAWRVPIVLVPISDDKRHMVPQALDCHDLADILDCHLDANICYALVCIYLSKHKAGGTPRGSNMPFYLCPERIKAEDLKAISRSQRSGALFDLHMNTHTYVFRDEQKKERHVSSWTRLSADLSFILKLSILMTFKTTDFKRHRKERS